MGRWSFTGSHLPPYDYPDALLCAQMIMGLLDGAGLCIVPKCHSDGWVEGTVLVPDEGCFFLV
jgi:hypothetical protein